MVKRKKILLTGATGTVGRLLYMHLGPWHDVHTPTSTELNLLDRNSVVHYLEKHECFDVIIHCAVKGANDVKSADANIATENIWMYHNIADYTAHYKKFINIASGCELGYDIPTLIVHTAIVEELLSGGMPEYPYGLSKNVIARDVLLHDNRYNLRLWGIISNTRIFSKLWDAVNRGDEYFEIDADRYQDYITEDELAKIVGYYVDHDDNLPRDINMVPQDKLKVSEVVQRYIEDNGLDIKVKVTGKASTNYYGSGEKLFQLGLL